MAEPDSFPKLDRSAFSVRGLHEENDEKQYWARRRRRSVWKPWN
jgi:hypothetical protein